MGLCISLDSVQSVNGAQQQQIDIEGEEELEWPELISMGDTPKMLCL